MKDNYKNNGQYGVSCTHNETNYRISPFISKDKIDSQLVKNCMIYKMK